ncbi:hypothetical protein DVH24_018826 [Malus domestica]|uniref:Peptidase A1 domain-containing protein n=1 Tax=Malus domestica TaxID=3750 RepID=A0A498HQP0_MALDO|nr:hypothetical protein DVH24_018826 [Malus domestica]
MSNKRIGWLTGQPVNHPLNNESFWVNPLASVIGNTPGCSSFSCIYDIQYEDRSFSVGFLGKEWPSLTPTDIFDGFLFECGTLRGGAVSLLGLGRDKISLVEQSALKYNRKGSGSSNAVKFTHIADISQGGSFYCLDVVRISVGGKKLLISGTIFSFSGTIIDFGTVITRLSATTYTALRDTFQQGMKSYRQLRRF